MTETVKRKGGFLAFIAFLFSVGALGASGYLYYEGMQYKKSANVELQQYITQMTQNIESNNQQISSLQNNLNDTIKRVDNLTPDNNRNLVNLSNELIGLANEGLILYNDVATAVRLLQNTQLVLNATNDPIFDNLKYAINHDLSILTNLPTIDRVAIGGQLDSLMTQINAIKQSKPTIDSKTTDSNVAMSNWDKFVANVKNTFSGLVNVSKSGGKSNQVLMPTEETAVMDSIRINLLSARVSLLQHDQQNWGYSLSNVKSLVDAYYSNLSGSDNVEQQIDKLIATPISNQNVNIDSTLKELSKLNSLR